MMARGWPGPEPTAELAEIMLVTSRCATFSPFEDSSTSNSSCIPLWRTPEDSGATGLLAWRWPPCPSEQFSGGRAGLDQAFLAPVGPDN